MTDRRRRLIEEWLPIAEIGIESVRERTPMTPFPAPNRLHVWWARRPLVASRAAILASLLPHDADRKKFLHALGIHGDPVAAKLRIADATRDGIRLGKDAYGYSRAFGYNLDADDTNWLATSCIVGPQGKVLDPTAGGGSIPFEAVRLGFEAVGNDLNAVAWMVLSATVDFPSQFGNTVLQRYQELGRRFVKTMQEKLDEFYTPEPLPDSVPDGYLWARTVKCPYCGGVVPLSPNWQLTSQGTGVKLVPHTDDEQNRHCTFEIVHKANEQSGGTVNAGNGECPFPDCQRVFDGDEIKTQAQAGEMGDQLFAVVYKQQKKVGVTKSGKDKVKTERGFRAPRPEDNVSEQVADAITERMSGWGARNIIPQEDVPEGVKTNEPRRSGMLRWQDMFNPRQLLGHCTSVEVFQDMLEELHKSHGGEIPELDKAALCYVAIAIDKLLNWNAILSSWNVKAARLRSVFDRHDFAFKWSYGEMAPTITGLGYDWAIKETGKALKELIELTSQPANGILSDERPEPPQVTITRGSADALELAEASVDCIVMDPPYYDNVMYAELADFFYVWLKRTAGLLYPEAFQEHLTDKDREAVANPAKFKGQKGGAKNLAGRDYQQRMADIFTECRRVLKPEGVMTVMFTHKASGAWDALASGLVQAGFVITASWPVNTEAEGSLHIKEKSAAKSTIFLVCRPRETAEEHDARYWEDVEPEVGRRVRERVAKFQAAGIGGVDLYLACFGPALEVFSENWPLQRGRPVTQPKEVKLLQDEEWNPYAVRPEDALEAARAEVKRWRMEQLATVKRQHHLDPLTEWFVLAWDAFQAPRFPSDEALKLARVVGIDFDKQIKNVVCEVKSSDVILWDSQTRRNKGKLGPISEDVMLNTLHHAALIGRTQNTGAAKAALEKAGLLEDATLMTALEALLNVLPAPGAVTKKGKSTLSGASADWEALEKLRRLALAEEVPESQTQTYLFDDSPEGASSEEE